MNKEILLIVESISNEKSMAKETIFRAIEIALETIAAKRYNEEVDVRVDINRKTGDYETFRRWTVVDNATLIETPGKQLTLEQAQKIDPELEIGDIVEEPIESVQFGRIAAQQAKQVIMREIRRAEHTKIISHYQELLNSLVSGIVKKITREGIILDMGDNIEALIPKDKLIPKEAVHMGDRVRGILYEINADKKGQLLLISRISPKVILELFKAEVPEISGEIIEIKAVARDPGSRSKMAVKTNDGRIDPIGACVGIRGARVQAVSNELGGERIDIILWDADPAQLVVNAMAPAEIASIIVDEPHHSMDLAVKEEQLAQAIGRNGQNVRLASEISGWKLNIITTTEAEKKTKTEEQTLIDFFTKNLDVDEEIAKILVNEGFHTLEDVAYTPIPEIAAIEGFDKEIAEALRNRARDVLLEQALTSKDKIGTVEPAKDLIELEGMTRHLAYVLASHGIVTREDLAEQSVDELSEIKELSEEQAAELIMAARKHWFE